MSVKWKKLILTKNGSFLLKYEFIPSNLVCDLRGCLRDACEMKEIDFDKKQEVPVKVRIYLIKLWSR